MFNLQQNYEINQYRIHDLTNEIQNDHLAASVAESGHRVNIRQMLVSLTRRFQSQQTDTQVHQAQLQEA